MFPGLSGAKAMDSLHSRYWSPGSKQGDVHAFFTLPTQLGVAESSLCPSLTKALLATDPDCLLSFHPLVIDSVGIQLATN